MSRRCGFQKSGCNLLLRLVSGHVVQSLRLFGEIHSDYLVKSNQTIWWNPPAPLFGEIHPDKRGKCSVTVCRSQYHQTPLVREEREIISGIWSDHYFLATHLALSCFPSLTLINIILTQDDLKNWPIDLKMLTSDVGPLLISQPGNPDCSRHASIEPDTIFLKIFPTHFKRGMNGLTNYLSPF